MEKRTWMFAVFTLILVTLALTACGGGKEKATEEAAAPAGDPEAGKEVFLNVGGCGACHTIEGVEGATGQVGPNLTQIATRAAQVAEKAGVDSAEAYIRQSILDPNAYIAEECPLGPCVAGTMPQTFKDQLSEKQLNDLVAFLMQQK